MWGIPIGKRIVMKYNLASQLVGLSANKFRRQTGKLIGSGAYVHIRDNLEDVQDHMKVLLVYIYIYIYRERERERERKRERERELETQNKKTSLKFNRTICPKWYGQEWGKQISPSMTPKTWRHCWKNGVTGRIRQVMSYSTILCSFINFM